MVAPKTEDYSFVDELERAPSTRDTSTIYHDDLQSHVNEYV